MGDSSLMQNPNDANNSIFAAVPGGLWRPNPVARGPFDGLQGGAVAALMQHEIRKYAKTQGLGETASATTHFLRAAPMALLRVNVKLVRGGRRVSVVEATLTHDDDTIALQRSTLINVLEQPELPLPPEHRVNPELFELVERQAPHSKAWMMDAMEARRQDPELEWFRLKMPIASMDNAPIENLLAIADWAHGLAPPLGAQHRPKVAIPNPDLTLHVLRMPKGEWCGIKHSTAWSTKGIGTGWGILFDTQGLIGHVGMSVVISPIAKV